MIARLASGPAANRPPPRTKYNTGMRIDAHQHFWHYDPAAHTWMTDAMASLKRDYLPADLQPLLRAAGLQGTVAVQAQQNVKETEWLLGLADQYDFIRGVVGWVDLRSPAVGDTLARLAAHPRLVGVRHIVHDEPDDDFMLRPDFLRGLAALSEFDLAYDLLLFPQHLPVAVEVVRQFPRQRFVLDHIAKPPIKAGTLAPWEAGLRALARFDNVCCKVSGMVTEARWRAWQPEDFAPFVKVVFDAFGSHRLMFGSDWPVCTLAADYGEVVALALRHTRALDAAAEERVFGGNAEAFYKLPSGQLAQ
jgi:L-fuconolactonase